MTDKQRELLLIIANFRILLFSLPNWRDETIKTIDRNLTSIEKQLKRL